MQGYPYKLAFFALINTKIEQLEMAIAATNGVAKLKKANGATNILLMLQNYLGSLIAFAKFSTSAAISLGSIAKDRPCLFCYYHKGATPIRIMS
ncbi:MAG: hypothetical protein OSA51_02650 [Octadecabacter sp.]|nr:hypothetical protein [Octadecabacter sp.]